MISKVIVIAEAGVNHNGDIQLAKGLIDAAAASKADYVKFQTFNTDLNISKTAKKAAYQIKAADNAGESQYEMVKNLELSSESFKELMEYSKSKGIKFLSTAFDIPSLEVIDSLVDRIKIPSGEITNYPYIKFASQLKKPIILSTGMADLGEIEAALEVLLHNGLQRSQITVLHCNTEYPTPMEDVNLRAMLTIQQAFGVAVGYSDHTLGIEVPIAAVALGASVIEKHFTLDRNLPGPDHKASLEPDELKAMVNAIRNIEQATGGHGRKEPSPSETPNKAIARKSIHLSRDISAGDTLTEQDLIPLRPGDGISPMNWQKVIGRSVTQDLAAGHQLTWQDLQ